MQKFLNIRTTLLTSLFLAPAVVSAQASGLVVKGGIESFGGLIQLVTDNVVRSASTLLMSLAILAFFFGIVKYVWGLRVGATEDVSSGKTFMAWGLVALFVMFSVYGIIKFAQGFFFNQADVTTIRIPNINFNASSTPTSGSDPLSNQNGPTGGAPTCSGTVGTAGAACSYGGASGTCTRNTETGDFYCRQ